MEDPISTVGTVFPDEDAVKTAIAAYNDKYFTEFTTTTNNKKTMVLKCKHGRKRCYKGTGKRPNQHYNFIGCNASINIYKNKDATLKITKADLIHNHEIGKNIYDLQNAVIDQDDQELIVTLSNATARPSQIKRVLKEKRGKTLSTKKIQNLIQKLSPSNLVETKTFEEFLQYVESNGGVVEWESDPDGSVRALFIATGTMKSALLSSAPTVIQLDTSFGIDQAHYKLTSFCYLNPVSNKTEVAALALLADESEKNFDFSLSIFKSIYGKEDIIFLVDKDFTCIQSIRRAYPFSTVLLCIFHVLKYLRTLFSTALVTKEIKDEIMTRFKSTLYARDAANFQINNNEFLYIIEGVPVRVNQSYVKLSDYYKKNWLSCTEMWVKYLRKDLPTLGDHTTNRVERMFWSLKKSIRETFISLPKTIASITHIVNYADRRLQESTAIKSMQSLRIYSNDPFIRELNDEASSKLNDRGCIIFNRSLKIFKELELNLQIHPDGVCEKFKNSEIKVYKTTSLSCNCTFQVEHQAPCRHIIFIRTLDEDCSIFDINMFNKRYHRVDLVPSETAAPIVPLQISEPLSDTDDFEESEDLQILSDREKFKQVMPVLLKIGNLISSHSTKDFYGYLEDLEDFEKAVRRGQRYRRKNVSLCDADTLNDNLSETATCDIISSTSTTPATCSSVLPASGTPTIALPESSPVFETSAVSALSSDATVLDSNSDGCRFQSLRFKAALKKKGRPKKSSKQVSFRRTALDNHKKHKANSVQPYHFKQLVRNENIDYTSQFIACNSLNLPNFQDVFDINGMASDSQCQATTNTSSEMHTNTPMFNHLRESVSYDL